MELLYLWINNCKSCIIGQEMNFSPLYKFHVDNKSKPSTLNYCKADIPINIMQKGNISNITALIGSNGSGKTTLLSYIAYNSCLAKMLAQEGYERFEENQYEREKSIYVFYDNDEFFVYHNLGSELMCKDFPDDKCKIYNNKDTNLNRVMIYNLRQQMIVYLTNSTYVREDFSRYSRSENTYNINLHPRSLNLVARRFYDSLFGIKEFDRATIDTPGFASIIKSQKSERTFQELLDVLYYNYLLKNNCDEYLGKFKDEIYVSFENILKLCDDTYHNDIERINISKRKIDDESTTHLVFQTSRIYYDKSLIFFEKYNKETLEQSRRKNPANVLYLNLLFEIFYYEDSFVLPDINFEEDIYSQLFAAVEKYDQYNTFLEDIKKIDDVLSEYNTYENIMDNPDDLACKYCKVINKANPKFYNFIEEIFIDGNSYVLRYIRIQNLNMSSGERAMQNMFSWLVLIPQLDHIMSIDRKTYTSKLLLIDEIDLYSHPEWQRRTIEQLILTIINIETMPVQIIVSSHSPVILSDFPRDNIIYLKKPNDQKTSVIDSSSDHNQSFGANIYTLFNDAFFMSNGVVGEFAKNKILEVYKELTNEDALTKEKSYYQYFIDQIGNDIIRNEMRKLLKRKLGR